jgi:hemerythrin superfamily protein
MTTHSDIVDALLADHEQAKKLLARMDNASPSQKKDLFWEITNDLVRHEVAEEEIVYPVARQVVPNGDRLAGARIREQSEAEHLLAEMEKVGTEDEKFDAMFQKLHAAVLEHAEKEQTLIFEPMRQRLDAEKRKNMAGLYEKAKSVAPTHPHPNAPDTPPGNIIVGPVAALVDGARDAIHKLAS